MKKIIYLAILPLVIFLTLTVSNAQMMGGGKGHMPCCGEGPGMMDKEHSPHMGYCSEGDCFRHLSMIDELDLSNEQHEKLTAIKLSFKKERIMLQAKMKVAKMEYHELLKKEKPNLKTIEKKIDQIINLKRDLMLNSASTSIAAREILSSEQLKKARGLMRDKKDQYKHFGGPRMMHRPWED